jgi:hypothetical protein
MLTNEEALQSQIGELTESVTLLTESVTVLMQFAQGLSEQIEGFRAQELVTRHYIGQMLEREVLPALGCPETPPWMQLDEHQLKLKRAILMDGGPDGLAAHWGIKDEAVRKRLLAEMESRGEGKLPWDKPVDSGTL